VSDYTPVFLPGDIIPLTASAAVTGRQLMEVSGNGTVAPTSTLQSTKIIGVAANDAPVNGRVTVYGRGVVHQNLADGTITAGDLIGSTSTVGREVKTIPPAAIDVGAAFNQAADNTAINAGLNTGRAILGVAMTTVADGQQVRWMLFGG
jgi:hypothetical protein